MKLSVVSRAQVDSLIGILRLLEYGIKRSGAFGMASFSAALSISPGK